ncbi:MAG: hypothetical protein HY458_02550 [Parcubacteria group bacterium]|nr:hypothetical protein [Parcubacteria group bacterium]
MKIFEFSFNPRADGDWVRRLLHKRERVFLLGELERPLPRDRKLLDELFDVAEAAWRPKLSSSKSLVRAALKRINQLLALRQKQGSIDWLGHLHCFLLFVGPGRKTSIPVYGAALGTVRAFLARNKKLTEIQKPDEKTPLMAPQSFGSMISGTLVPGDRLFLFTKGLSQPLIKDKLLYEILGLEKESDMQSLFRKKRARFAKISGLLSIITIPMNKTGDISSPALFNRALSLPRPAIRINVTKNQLLLILLLTILGVGFVLFRLLDS